LFRLLPTLRCQSLWSHHTNLLFLPTVCIETIFPKRSLAWGLEECQHQASHTERLLTHLKTKEPKRTKDQRGSRGCKSQASRFVEHGSYRTFSMPLACSVHSLSTPIRLDQLL